MTHKGYEPDPRVPVAREPIPQQPNGKIIYPSNGNGRISIFSQITPGDWLKVVVFLLSLIVAGVRLDARVSRAEEVVVQFSADVKEMQKTMNQILIEQARQGLLIEQLAKQQSVQPVQPAR